MNGANLRVQKPLTLRLFKRVLLFSALVLTFLVGARTWWEYQGALADVHEEFAIIESTKARSVASSLWDFDREQLALHTEGIRHFRYITYVGVRDASGIVVQSGVRRTKGVLDREFPLFTDYNGQRQDLGVLHVQADLERLRQTAWRTARLVLAYNVALVLLVAGLIFWLTSNMVSRHLAAFAAHLSSYSLGGDNRPLVLDKKNAGDELDVLASALNTMQDGLSASYGQVLAAQAEVRSMARFYQVNPSPVLRAGAEGLLLMVNAASADLLEHLGVQVGRKLPEVYAAIVARALVSGEVQHFEIEFGGRAFAFAARPVPAEGFVNIYGMDITGRKAAENALRKSEAILQAAMDQSQAGIAIADAPSGRLRYVNKAGRVIRGEGAGRDAPGAEAGEYVAGWKTLDLDGRPLDGAETPLARAVMHGETSSREFIIRRAEGDDRIVWANAAPILDERGQVSAGIVVFLDITERKAAEAALRASETRIRALFDATPDSAILMDAEGVILAINDHGARRRGLAPQDMVGDSIYDHLPPGAAETRRQEIQEALRTRRPRDYEEERQGSWYALTIYPILDTGGLPRQLASFSRDITRQKESEQLIMSNNVRLQCLVRVLQHNAESVQEFLDFSLTEALRLTESRFGYIYHYNEVRREFILNTWSSEVMAECMVKSPQSVYALDKTGIWGEAVRQRRPIVVNDFQADNALKKGYPEGHVHLHNFMTVPVLLDGRIVAVAGVGNKDGGYQDVDVQQLSLLLDACWQVVGRLDAEQGVLSSLHEKEILLKEIHHRVKNNLQIISSLLFLQAEYVQNPEDRTMFEESQKRISAMALVHEELYGSADLSSVDMGEYVPRLVERVVASADVPVQVDFDVEALRLPVTRSIPCGLVLNEMVMNAVKHAFRSGRTGRNGQESRLRVSLGRSAGQVELAVEDNGPGLPQGFSLESASTLGLTLITSLARQLAGSVTAQNLDGGARFALRFPVEEQP